MSGTALLLQPKQFQWVSVSMKRGQPVVEQFVQEPFPSADPDERLKVLQAALVKVRAKAKKVRIGISSDEVILRYFTMPLVPKKEWSSAIQFEVRKYLPFQLKELVWDFYATSNESTKQLAVAFVAVRKEVFSAYQRLIQALDLRVEGLEPAPFGLTRMMGVSVKPAAGEITACVHLAGDAASIIFVRGQLPLLSRDVSLTVQEELKPLEPLIAAAQSESPPTTSAMPQEAEARLQVLARELRVSFEYFKRNFPQELLTRVVLYGDSSLEYWVAPLQAQLRLPVEQGMAFPTARGMEQLPSGWAMAVGVALGQVVRAGPTVLFATQEPGALTPKRGIEATLETMREPELVRLAVVEAVAAGLILWGCAHWLAQQTAQLRGELHGLQAELQAQDAARAGLPPEELTNQLTELKAQVESLNQLVGPRRVLLTPLLAAVAQQQAEGIWLTGLAL